MSCRCAARWRGIAEAACQWAEKGEANEPLLQHLIDPVFHTSLSALSAIARHLGAQLSDSSFSSLHGRKKRTPGFLRAS